MFTVTAAFLISLPNWKIIPQLSPDRLPVCALRLHQTTAAASPPLRGAPSLAYGKPQCNYGCLLKALRGKCPEGRAQ